MIYFVGNESELSYCLNAQNILNTSKEEFCNNYAGSFDYNCDPADNFSLQCQTTFANLNSVSNITTDLIISVGTVNDILNRFSYLSHYEIIISDFKPDHSNISDDSSDQCYIKGTLNYALLMSNNFHRSITIKHLKLVPYANINFNIPNINFISCDFEPHESYSFDIDAAYMDGCTIRNLQKYEGSFLAKELYLNISTETDTTVTLSDQYNNYTINEQAYTVQHSHFQYIYLYSETTRVIFNVDNSLPADQKLVTYIGFVYTGNDNVTISLEAQKSSIDYVYTLYLDLHQNEENVNFNLTGINDIYYNLLGKSEDPIINNYYYITDSENNYNQCIVAKELLETDSAEFCYQHGVKFFYKDCFDNKKDFTITCIKNDGNIIDEFDSQYNHVNIVINSDNASLDLSKLHRIQYEYYSIKDVNIMIEKDISNIGRIASDCKPISKYVSLVGGNLSFEELIINNVSVSIISKDLNISKISLFNCEILDGEYIAISDRMTIDECASERINENSPIRTDQLSYHFYRPWAEYGTTITFTESHWVFTHFNSDEVFSVPYSICNILYAYGNCEKYVFNVDDPTTAKLKAIGIFSIYWSGIYTLLNTGNWSLPLEGPLKIHLNRMLENGFLGKYDINGLDMNWFVFDVEFPTLPPSTPQPSYLPQPTQQQPTPDSQYQPEWILLSSVSVMMISDNDIGCDDVKQNFDICKENPDYDANLCEGISMFKGIFCSRSDNINDHLPNIPDDCVLLIQSYEKLNSMDLRLLKHKIPVYIGNANLLETEGYNNHYSKLLDLKTMSLDILNRKNRIPKIKHQNDELSTLIFNGDIKEKVSFLSIFGMSILVNESSLDNENLELFNSTIDSDSKLIQSIKMIVDTSTHLSIEAGNLYDKIRVGQYSLNFFDSNAEQPKYRVAFYENNWLIIINHKNRDEYIDVPYNICGRLSLIAVSHYFSLDILSSSIVNLKPVNITLMFHPMGYEIALLEDNKYSVQLITLGDWSQVTGNLSVYFTSFSEYVSFESNCDSKVQVSQFSINTKGELTPPAPDDDQPPPPPSGDNTTISQEASTISQFDPTESDDASSSSEETSPDSQSSDSITSNDASSFSEETSPDSQSSDSITSNDASSSSEETSLDSQSDSISSNDAPSSSQDTSISSQYNSISSEDTPSSSQKASISSQPDQISSEYLQIESPLAPETNLPSPTTPPVIIVDNTTKDNSYIGSVDASSNKPDETKKEIEDLFNKQTDENTQKDQVINVSSSSGQIEIADLNLSSNQYIKFDDNSDVHLSSGDLNIVLDDNSKSIKVTVSDPEDVKLSIKNGVECTVNIETQGTDKSDVVIKSKSEVYEPLNLIVGDNVQSLTIESVNLHNSGSIEAKDSNQQPVNVTVSNLEAQPQTNGKLTNVKVVNEFNITQSATLELDKVDLGNAKLNLNLHTYTQSNYNDPILNGTLGRSPSSITLKKLNDDSPLPKEGQQFLLFQGLFETSCSEWKDAINFSNSYFNDRKCEALLKSSLTLSERSSLFVLRSENNSSNKNKLGPGEIAGIVIGCIAGVAIIVIVIVFVLKKKKKQQSSSETDNNEEQIDL